MKLVLRCGVYRVRTVQYIMLRSKNRTVRRSTVYVYDQVRQYYEEYRYTVYSKNRECGNRPQKIICVPSVQYAMLLIVMHGVNLALSCCMYEAVRRSTSMFDILGSPRMAFSRRAIPADESSPPPVPVPPCGVARER